MIQLFFFLVCERIEDLYRLAPYHIERFGNNFFADLW